MAQCKKKADLHRKYAQINDMCEGTETPPYKCVKHKNNLMFAELIFTGKPEDYQFALAIVEGKPVFPGDVLYLKDGGNKITVDIESEKKLIESLLSWQPPHPKKLVLNGVELPMPLKTFKSDFELAIPFSSQADLDEFGRSFLAIVNEQRE